MEESFIVYEKSQIDVYAIGMDELQKSMVCRIHRTSLGKSTDVLHQKYGCLPQRSPMFLFSGKGEKY